MDCPKCNGFILNESCINCGYSELKEQPDVYNYGRDGQMDRFFSYPPGTLFPGKIKRRTKEQMGASN